MEYDGYYVDFPFWRFSRVFFHFDESSFPPSERSRTGYSSLLTDHHAKGRTALAKSYSGICVTFREML